MKKVFICLFVLGLLFSSACGLGLENASAAHMPVSHSHEVGFVNWDSWYSGVWYGGWYSWPSWWSGWYASPWGWYWVG